MESDHSIKTVQSKGAAIEHSSGGKIPYVSPPQWHPRPPSAPPVTDNLNKQLPQTRLVARRRLVRTTPELEVKYRGNGACGCGDSGDSVEY